MLSNTGDQNGRNIRWYQNYWLPHYLLFFRRLYPEMSANWNGFAIATIQSLNELRTFTVS